jgi:hypothetical protein
MLISNKYEIEWREIIESISNHIERCTRFWAQEEEGQIVEIPTPEEYAGLVGSLLILANRGGHEEAKRIISDPTNRAIFKVALHGMSIKVDESYPSSSAACAIALLHTEDDATHPEEDGILLDTEKDVKTSFEYWGISLKKGETINERIKKGEDRLNEIIEKPKRNTDVVKKMISISERAGIDVSDFNEGLDLRKLRE